MTQPIRSVAVLGSGVMGAGIAAHCANAGIPVLLLDIVPKDAPKDASKNGAAARNVIVSKAVAGMAKTKPAPLYTTKNLSLIEVGNLDDDLERASQCDLVVEAVIERLDIKQGLFSRLEKVMAKNTVIASNTSGLRIAEMLEGRSPSFRKQFCVTHFFNPPRYMKLLELVSGPDTDPAVMQRLENFGREKLGKGIVYGKDTPNFVANRIGVHAMMVTIGALVEKGLTQEDVDAITGVPMGHPKSGTFRLSDMVGLDTLAHVVRNCYESLTDDEDRDVFKIPAFVETMIEKKLLGNKTKAGFYRKSKAGIETLDIKTGDYRAKGGDEAIKKQCKDLGKVSDLSDRLRKLVATDGVVGEFAWQTISRTLAYSANRVGEISDDIIAIDDAMRWGFNWEFGPFQTWDALGFGQTFDRMKKEGMALPASVEKMRKDGIEGFYKDGEFYDLATGKYVALKTDPRDASLTVLRKGNEPVLKNKSAVAWDLGDGVLGLTLTSKQNSVDPDVIKMLNEATAKAEADFQAMVIFNEGDHFCVGANLMLVVMAAQQKQWDQVENLSGEYQQAVQRLKYSQVPVIGAPFGMTLGGGLELAFGCDAVQAAAETYSGLVEVGVGVIPGGAGCLNMLWRALEGIPEGAEIDTYAIVTQVFKNIATAKVATSAHEAMDLGFFRRSDGVSFDKARQLHEAKARAIGMAQAGYHAPAPRAYRLPGDSGIATLQMIINTMMASGFASEHDGLIARKVATVLCGGVGGASHLVTEQEVLDLEREAFLSLCGEKKSQERMQHMLMNNKPLRN